MALYNVSQAETSLHQEFKDEVELDTLSTSDDERGTENALLFLSFVSEQANTVFRVVK